MSCRFCVHFRRPDEYDWEADENVGQCTFNPVWVDVNDAHYCSRFLQEAPCGFSSTLTFENNRSLHRNQRELDAERHKRISLEKKNKGLRQQIRDLKKIGREESGE